MNYFFIILSLLTLISCSTSPTGRKQLIMMPESQMAQMGLQSFQQMKQKMAIEKDKKINTYVKCITKPITQIAGPTLGVRKWEVVVFKEKSANAFALPGGYIGVHTGILKVAETPNQLATVLGHEVGHVIAQHGNERVSQAMGANIGLATASVLMGNKNPRQKNTYMALLGLGAQVGVLMPFGRTQESEADAIGIHLMAKAGFDPRQSVQLWQNMKKASGGKSPPEFLSTHPNNDSRISGLNANMPEAMSYYQKRKAKGPLPSCKL